MKFSITNNTYAALQEMICFLNDGKAVYEKALERTTDDRLKSYFIFLLQQRSNYANELNAFLLAEGLDTEDSGTLKGKIFIHWMEVKAGFSGSVHENEQLISCCLFIEQRIQQAYKELLRTDCLSIEQKFMVTIQQQGTKLALTKLYKMKAIIPASGTFRFI
jgi:uncharacterized protein (TIGR02284 family)